jgi:hypothetical protein
MKKSGFSRFFCFPFFSFFSENYGVFGKISIFVGSFLVSFFRKTQEQVL